MGTGSFPGIKCGRGVLLTTHPLLVSRSWKSRAIPLPTLWATPGLWRDHFNFTFFVFVSSSLLGTSHSLKNCAVLGYYVAHGDGFLRTTEWKSLFLFLSRQILTNSLRRGHYPFLPHSLQFTEHLPSYFVPRSVCVTEIAVNSTGYYLKKSSYI